MRNQFLFIALIAMCCSCGNTEQPATTEAAASPSTETMADANPVPGAKMDPVCEMVYDETWTESTVYMNDTIRFCSENCKTAFLARPEKYAKAH